MISNGPALLTAISLLLFHNLIQMDKPKKLGFKERSHLMNRRNSLLFYLNQPFIKQHYKFSSQFDMIEVLMIHLMKEFL